MGFDSTIRLRQLNQQELSGYVGQVVSFLLTNSGLAIAATGKLTGAFYPYSQNPANYQPSGAFATSSDINSAMVTENVYIASNYYPLSNPSKFSSISVNGSPVPVANFTGVGGTVLTVSGNTISVSGGGGGVSSFVSTGSGINLGLTPTSGFNQGQLIYNWSGKTTGSFLGFSGHTLFFGTGSGSNLYLDSGFIFAHSLQVGNTSATFPNDVTPVSFTQLSPALGNGPEGAYPAEGHNHIYRIYPIFGDSQGNLLTPGSVGDSYFADDGNPDGFDPSTSNYNIQVNWSYITTLNIEGFRFQYFKIFKDDDLNNYNFGVAYKTSGLSFVDDNSMWVTPNTDTSLPPLISNLSPAFYVDGYRNVGIKKSNPLFPLDVNGTIGATDCLITNKMDTANHLLVCDYESPEIPYGIVGVLDWHSNQLLNPGGGTSLDWRNYQLYNPNGISLDWGSSNTYDSSQATSMDWSQRLLYDNGFEPCVDWQNRLLIYNNGNVSVDWANERLYNRFGNTIVDWGGTILLDNSEKIGVDWYNRYLGDNSGTQQLVWNNTGVNIQRNLTILSGVYAYGGLNSNSVNPVGTGTNFAIGHTSATINGTGIVTSDLTGNFLTKTSISNGAGGSGLYTTTPSPTIKSIAAGTGITISGSNTTLTFNLLLGQVYQTGLQSDFTMTSGNNWYNILSGSFSAGTYMVEAQASLTTNPNVSTRLYAKLYDGTNSPWASCGQFQGGVASNTGEANLGLSRIITLTGTQSIVLATCSSDTGNLTRSKLWSSSSTVSGNSLGTTTYISLCRLF